jgi:hypothetical protein
MDFAAFGRSDWTHPRSTSSGSNRRLSFSQRAALHRKYWRCQFEIAVAEDKIVLNVGELTKTWTIAK